MIFDSIEKDNTVLFHLHYTTAIFKNRIDKKLSVNEKSVIEMWISIKDEVLEYLEDIEFLSLLAHGSFAEGLANRTSDFDLLVVCAENVQEREDVLVVNEIEINIEILHKKTIEEQVKSLEELLGPRKLGFKIPMACRLKHAVILVDKDNNGKNLVDMINQFQPSKNIIDLYSKCGLNYYYDAVGAMASGDYATSIHMARLGALHVLTGIMLSQGELYVKKKWLIKLMDKIPFESKELLLKVMGLDSVGREQAEKCIHAFNQLISEFERLKE